MPDDLMTSLGDWVLAAGIADEVSGDGLVDGRALREAIYQIISDRMSGEPYDDTALRTVNRFAREPDVTPQLSSAGRRTTATAAQALSTIARDAIAVVSGPAATRLRECGRPGCTQVYLDHSRGGQREWCSMKACGNRTKAQAYRDRQRVAA